MSGGNGRTEWRYKQKAKEFHAAHGYAPYTMVPNTTLEAEMYDPNLAKEWRVLSAVRRYAWGNLSDGAVDRMPKLDNSDPEPRPLLQEDLASILNLSKSLISESCGWLKSQGYLRTDSAMLYPDDKSQPSLFASLKAPSEKLSPMQSSSDCTNLPSPFVRYRESYFVENTDFSENYAALCADRDRFYAQARAAGAEIRGMDRRILAAFQKLQRQQSNREQKANVSANGSHNPEEPGADSDCGEFGSELRAIQFGTAANSVRDCGPEISDCRTAAPVTPCDINAESGPPLTKLEVLNQASSSSSGSSSPPEHATTTTEQSTEREAIPVGDPLSEVAQVGEAIEQHGIPADDPATKALIDGCRRQVPGCPVSDIVFFVGQKAQQAHRGREPIKLLTAAVINCFIGESYRRHRQRLEAAPPAAPMPDMPDPEALAAADLPDDEYCPSCHHRTVRDGKCKWRECASNATRSGAAG